MDESIKEVISDHEVRESNTISTNVDLSADALLYEQKKNNISHDSKKDMISAFVNYENSLKESNTQYTGTIANLYLRVLEYFKLDGYAKKVQQQKLQKSVELQSTALDNLEKLLENKNQKRDFVFEKKQKTSALMDDAFFVAKYNAKEYQALQKKKEEIIGLQREFSDQEIDMESSGKQKEAGNSYDLEVQIHNLEANMELVDRTGDDALTSLEQYQYAHNLHDIEYIKLQEEIHQLSKLRGITQRNFKIYKTMLDKLEEQDSSVSEINLLKQIYSMNNEVTDFMQSFRAKTGGDDIYQDIKQNQPTMVKVDLAQSRLNVSSGLPDWIMKTHELEKQKKQSLLKK